MLAEPPEDHDTTEPVIPRTPKPTPTNRVPDRPHETPTSRPRKIGGQTAGTRTYGAQGGTPSTERLHNPTHFR